MGNAAFDTGDLYYNLSMDLPFDPEGFWFTAFAGYSDFEEQGKIVPGEDLSYAHWAPAATWANSAA